MNELDDLARRVGEAIPLTRYLEFSYGSFDGLALTVTAPLEPNCNDKGTFFAGSQAALVTLAGWSMTTLQADHAGFPSDVVAVESHLRYTLPLQDEMRLRATVTEEKVARFRQRLEQKGRAVLTVDVRGQSPAGEVVCEFQGVYLARRPVND